MTTLFIIIAFMIGIILGYFHEKTKELLKLVKKLEKQVEEKPKTFGVAGGAYKLATETKQTPGVVRPKSPQRIEWEANEQRRKDVLGIQ